MQVSTARFYDRSTQMMSRLQDHADTLMVRNATGKRLQAPSDDAVAYRKLQGIAQANADDKVFGDNLKVAGGVLAQADSVLTGVTGQLQQASELALKAANGTMTPQDRRIIGQEMESVLQALVQLANAKDPRGQSLFGGADGGGGAVLQPDGSYKLAAIEPPAVPPMVPIGEGEAIQVTETAARVFGFEGVNGPTDAIAVVAALRAALADGTDQDAIAAGVEDLKRAGDQVAGVQASLGARAARVDMAQAQIEDAATDRELARSGLEDADYAATLVELQKTMTILSATQASFSKLSSMSLFDYLR